MGISPGTPGLPRFCSTHSSAFLQSYSIQLYGGLVGGLPFVALVALLACVGGLAFVVCAFGGFLL